jgi:hypothetical protein
MSTVPTEIRIVSVDKNKITKAPNSSLYSYPFRLSGYPDKEWLAIFKNKLGAGMSDGGTLDTQVMGDTIYVKMSAEENVQTQLDIQKQFVAEVNKEYNQAQQRKAEEQEIIDNKKQAADDELRRLRDQTDNLKF